MLKFITHQFPRHNLGCNFFQIMMIYRSMHILLYKHIYNSYRMSTCTLCSTFTWGSLLQTRNKKKYIKQLHFSIIHGQDISRMVTRVLSQTSMSTFFLTECMTHLLSSFSWVTIRPFKTLKN